MSRIKFIRSYLRIGHDFYELRSAPIGGVVVAHRRFHVFQLVQDGEHVDELPQRQQIGLGNKITTQFLCKEVNAR